MPARRTDAEPLTPAQRQARRRARLAAAEPTPVVKTRRPVDRRGRAQRWKDAVAELGRLQLEYQAWLDTMPEALADSPTATALEAILAIDLAELEAVEPPRGFGRD